MTTALPTPDTIPGRGARGVGCAVSAGGLLVLVGWVLGIDSARSILPAWPRMAPATALGFVLAGTALACLSVGPSDRRAWRFRALLGRALAVAAALIGTLKLGDYLLGLGLDFDTLGAGDAAFVAPATALAFVLSGCALVFASTRFFGL